MKRKSTPPEPGNYPETQAVMYEFMSDLGAGARRFSILLGEVVKTSTIQTWYKGKGRPKLALALEQMVKSTGWRRDFWMAIVDAQVPGLARAYLNSRLEQEVIL